MAAQMVSAYDAAASDPDRAARLHRVSHYMLSPEHPNLGGDLRLFAEGHPMSSRLRTEISAYQACMLDDSAVEGPHARIGRVCRGAPHCGAPWWSATIRLAQNSAAREERRGTAPGLFENMFSKWKVLAQASPRRYELNIPARISNRAFADLVYRTGQRNLVDWSALGIIAAAFSTDTARPQRQRSEIRQLQDDYLRCVLKDGSFLSWEKSDILAIADLADGEVAAASAAPTQVEVVQVVSMNSAFKKHVLTDTVRKWRAMRVPCVVQHQAVMHTTSADSEEEGMQVYPMGFPVVADAASLAPWKQLSSGITVWGSVASATTLGCQRLQQPVLLHQ